MSELTAAFLDSYRRSIPRDRRVVLAVSGGVDSMVLLSLFLAYHPHEHIIVAHVDHCLRGDASDGDRIFVEDFCKVHDLCFVSEKCDIEALSAATRSSLESAGRKERYDFLMRVCRDHHARVLSTAHHLDDRIETALFNLIRGTKLDGIHALSEQSVWDDVELVRPLIAVTKEMIQSYARERCIPFREDSTNTDTTYLRNHIRHTILPQFRTINPHAGRALEHFIAYTESVSIYLDTSVSEWLSRFPLGQFSSRDFSLETGFFQREIIRHLYQRMNHGTVGLSEGNIAEMIRFIVTARGGTEKRIKRLLLKKRNSTIWFYCSDLSLN